MTNTTNLPWSDHQKAAFTAAMAGTSIMLEAGPGSGKTTTIVAKVKMMVEAGRTGIVVTAFGTGIQDALKAKLADYTKGPNAPVKVIGTYGLGYGPLARFLKTKGLEPKVVKEKYYAICRDLINDSLTTWGFQGYKLDRKVGEYVTMLTKQVDFARLTMTKPHDKAAIDKMVSDYTLETEPFLFPLIERAINAGSAQAEKEGVVDFCDMLYLSLLWKLRFWQYNVVIVDEAQDLSRLQREALLKSLRFDGQFIGVGDPKQSIMGFSGADMHSFTATMRLFKATKLPLPICYRSDLAIVAEINAVIPGVEARPGAAVGLVRTIDEETLPDDMMAAFAAGEEVVGLSRTTAPLIGLCLTFWRKGQAANVKGRDIGERILDYLDEISSLDGFNYDLNFREYMDALENMRLRKYQTFNGLDWEVIEGKERQVDMIMDYFECIELCYTGFLAPTLDALKAKIASLFEEGVRGIQLMTGHRSKGLEFDSVYIVNADKMRIFWPGMNADQAYQEKCVQFVMVSRARHKLTYSKNLPKK